MLVENDTETCLTSLTEDVVELREPLRLEPVLRVHMAKRLQIDANEIEPGLPDLGEVAPFEAALATFGPVRVVTENVHAAPKRLVGLSENWRWVFRSHCRSRRDETCESKQTQ